MTAPAEDLDDIVRRADPDRWLASRFIADAARRADVVALYAYDNELARAPRVASNALVGEIRLVWWREALDEIFEGRPVRGHPVAQALAGAVARHGLPRAPLAVMVDARYRELDGGLLDRADAHRLADGTAGAAAGLAARVLGAERETAVAAAGAWAAVWALSLMLLNGRIEPADAPAVRAAAAEGLDEARSAGRHLLDAAAFPAAAYATLADTYLRGRPASELAKRLRLTWAVARGRA